MKPWLSGDFGEPVVPKGCGRLFSEGTGGGTEKGKKQGPWLCPCHLQATASHGETSEAPGGALSKPLPQLHPRASGCCQDNAHLC